MYLLTIDENIRRLLTTIKLTRPLRADLGASRVIDEVADIDALIDVRSEIIALIKENEPRVELSKLQVSRNEKGFSFSITYILNGTDETENLKVDL